MPKLPSRRLAFRVEWEGVVWKGTHKAVLSTQDLRDLNSADVERVYAALERLIVSHDGWQDEDGEPLSEGGAAIREVPYELANEILKAVLAPLAQ
jgi:hypothetical protein